MKIFVKSLTLLIVASFLFSSPAFAKNDNAKKSLVALGDSIPYGYNLGETNDEPSKYAFPYLMGEDANIRVRNLSIPGWRTDQLLDAVKNDQKYRQAIRHADYVTLNIGSNDLLAALHTAQRLGGGDYNSFLSHLQIELAKSPMLPNLQEILMEIQGLTDATVVLYNIYNPFQTADSLHLLGVSILPSLNQAILAKTNLFPNVKIADAYSAYGDQQGKYVRANDIHPTIEGQRVLANIGLEVLGLRFAYQVN